MLEANRETDLGDIVLEPISTMEKPAPNAITRSTGALLH